MDKVENNPASELKKVDPSAQAELSDQELDGVVGGGAQEDALKLIQTAIPLITSFA